MRALAMTLALVGTAAAAEPPAPAAATQSATPPAPAAASRLEIAPTQALVDRMGQGDRLFLAGDHRGALFAYQDAVYLQPRYAPARVRLGRAYLALRYPEQAIAQAEAALAEDPESAEARKLLEEARSAPARPKPGAAAATPGVPAPAAEAPPASPARPGPRVFKLSPEPDAPAARPPGAAADAAQGGVAAPQAAGSPAGEAAAPAGTVVAPVPVVADGGGGAGAAPEPLVQESSPAAATPAPGAAVAAQHYRAALGFLQGRDWAKAVAALSDAILADPTLAVAYSARGSAQFGLGKYRDAAEDYGAAMRLDPDLATPVYGLAECHRVLGDGKKAAALYERYAKSGASDVRDDLRATAARRAEELR